MASSVASMAPSNRASMTSRRRRIDGVDPDGRAVVVVGRQVVACRERDEQVAARVTAGAAGARDAEPGPLGEPLALVGEERRVGRDDDDDRARAGRRQRRAPARPSSHGLGTSSTPISAPTGTPSTRSQARLP